MKQSQITQPLIQTLSAILLLLGAGSTAANELRTPYGETVRWAAEALVTEPASEYTTPWRGLGSGGLAGALLGGPLGLVIGASGGALLEQNSHTQQLLDQSRGTIRALEQQIGRLREAHQQQGKQLQQLFDDQQMLARHRQQLTDNYRLQIHFRTDSAEIEPGYLPTLDRLARLLKQQPQLKLCLNAGSDRRGSNAHNQALAERRARKIAEHLTERGITAPRIGLHARGEQQANHPEGDIEGLMFDRLVTIRLATQQPIDRPRR